MKTSPPKLLIRADSGPHVGVGHVLRCLALAHAWRVRGGSAVFLGRHGAPAVRDRLEAEGHACRGLSGTDGDDEPVGETIAAIVREGPDWVVIDGYHLGQAHQTLIRQTGVNLLVIDDGVRFPAYDADIVLNQNLGAERLSYEVSRGGRALLGTDYAMLRPEFFSWRGHRKGGGPARNVLVTLGGADPGGLSGFVLESFDRVARPGLKVKVVVGPANPRAEALRRLAEGCRADVEVLTDPADMPALLAWADLAISAAGSTCWELAFIGVPSLLIVAAENQQPLARGLADLGAAVSLDESGGLDPEAIAAAVGDLMDDPGRRARLADRGRSLVDGYGAERVVLALRRTSAEKEGTPTGLVLRPARVGDAELFWEWANDPTVRGSSFRPETIPWEDHVRWFGDRLASPSSRIFVMEAGGTPVGQIRYEIDRGRNLAEIGFSVSGACRGRGYGLELLRRTTAVVASEFGLNEVVGFVLRENVASSRTFAKAGYARSAAKVSGRDCDRFSWRSHDLAETDPTLILSRSGSGVQGPAHDR